MLTLLNPSIPKSAFTSKPSCSHLMNRQCCLHAWHGTLDTETHLSCIPAKTHQRAEEMGPKAFLTMNGKPIDLYWWPIDEGWSGQAKNGTWGDQMQQAYMASCSWNWNCVETRLLLHIDIHNAPNWGLYLCIAVFFMICMQKKNLVLHWYMW